MNHLVPHLGRRTIAGVTTSDVQALVAKLHNGGMKASTIVDRMGTVQAIFSAAVKDKRIADNPCDGVNLPRVKSQALDPDSIPDLAEVNAIARAMSGQYG